MSVYKQIKINPDVINDFTKGDIEAFDLIYFTFNKRLYSFIFSLVKIRTETEGIVQDIFVKIWESRSGIKKQESFESFLFSVAYKTTINHLRKRATEKKYIEYIKSVQLDLVQPKIEEKMDLEKFNQTLNQAINKLPNRQQEVFKLKHFENYSYKQIAQKLDISVNTVENHIVRSHKILRQNLKENYTLGLFLISMFF